jgi:acylphosphatase
MRRAIAALSAVFLLAVTPAAALEPGQAEAVVGLLERLAPERAETVYYDEEAAIEWFDYDAETEGLIAAAGFTRQTWKMAFDETLKGYIATIPDAEVDAMFGGFEAHVSQLTNISDEDKQSLIHDWRLEMQGFNDLRVEGQQYASVVQPFAARLKVLGEQQ